MRTQHLHRTWYSTDASTEDPDYVGAFTQTFPRHEDRTVVNVEWDKPGKGWVEVTFLINGEGFASEHPYPWPTVKDEP